jgi:hypothetical protein
LNQEEDIQTSEVLVRGEFGETSVIIDKSPKDISSVRKQVDALGTNYKLVADEEEAELDSGAAINSNLSPLLSSREDLGFLDKITNKGVHRAGLRSEDTNGDFDLAKHFFDPELEEEENQSKPYNTIGIRQSAKSRKNQNLSSARKDRIALQSAKKLYFKDVIVKKGARK